RALPRWDPTHRGDRQRQPPGAGLRPLGPARTRPVGERVCDDGPDESRLHRHRRPQAGYEPQRHGCGSQPRRRWPALAPARPHPHVGAVVGPPPAGSVVWPGMSARKVDHLLIGGGLASANCAHWLRQAGADGEVLLVGREPDPPYNRPNCSKGYLQRKEAREEAYFRPNEWWEEQRIELLTRTTVRALDLGSRTATLSSNEEVS